MFKANCSGDGSLGHVWMIYYIFNTGKYKVQVCKNSKKKVQHQTEQKDTDARQCRHNSAIEKCSNDSGLCKK